MNNPAASSGVSLGAVILFAASGGEFGPERLKIFTRVAIPCQSELQMMFKNA